MRELDLEQGAIGGAPAVRLSGELNFENSPSLRAVLLRLAARKVSEMVLDLTDLAFMDTSGLATLIEARMTAHERGGRVILLGLQPLIAQVFEVARVNELFTLVQDEKEALAVLGERVD